MTARAALPLLAAVAVAACATPETRLRNGLVDAGLAEPMAACMAERMVDRLSLLQLRRLGDLPRAREAAGLEQFLHRVRALGDREILTVSSAAAARCAVGIG